MNGDDTHTVLAEVAEERLRRGLTLAQLGAEVGRTESTLCRLLKGRTRPMDQTTYRLRQWLKASRRRRPC